MTKLAAILHITVNPINSFLSKKGWDEGRSSDVYYKAYQFFEKLRIMRGERKSSHRMKSE
jgi:hypothetical protein